MKRSVNRIKGNILANVILTKQLYFFYRIIVHRHTYRFTLLAINTSTIVIEDT